MKKWTSALGEITGQVLTEFGDLTSEQLAWKPNPTTWSIAQNLDHLIVVNETYFPVLESLKAGNYKTPFIAQIGFMVSFIGKTVLQAVQPDRKKKMKTFPIWEPSESHSPGNIIERFQTHQNELTRHIEMAKELVDKGVVISSPANRYVVYKLETAFDIIASHEQRHVEQSREIMQLMRKKSG